MNKQCFVELMTHLYNQAHTGREDEERPDAGIQSGYLRTGHHVIGAARSGVTLSLQAGWEYPLCHAV